MKQLVLAIIFLLILITSLVKNSTKEIEDQIFAIKENIRPLKSELEDVLLEFNYLSSPEKLVQYQRQYFEKDLIMWEIWDKIQCPVLVLRGKKSQVLTQETALEMMSRGPKTRVVEVEDAGHTPNIMDMEQISVI